MSKLISLFIIIVITSLVVGTASAVVWASVTDKQSNVRLTAELIDHVDQARAALPTPSPEIHEERNEIASPQPQVACLALPKQLNLPSYLQSRGMSRSFEFRTELAIQHGIQDYVGDWKQNVKLLKILMDEESNAQNCQFEDAQLQ